MGNSGFLGFLLRHVIADQAQRIVFVNFSGGGLFLESFLVLARKSGLICWLIFACVCFRSERLFVLREH